jgi:hypothetical protein
MGAERDEWRVSRLQKSEGRLQKENPNTVCRLDWPHTTLANYPRVIRFISLLNAAR